MKLRWLNIYDADAFASRELADSEVRDWVISRNRVYGRAVHVGSRPGAMALWFLVGVTIGILAYHAGGAKQREFEAECGSPGVRCYMLLTPEYVETHDRISLPEGVTGAFFDGNGSLRGVLQ